ncbi:MAG: hypothetical protein QW343_00850 [Candidatus Norongarragalinales archaeon]
MRDELIAKYPFLTAARKFVGDGDTEVSFEELEQAARHINSVLANPSAPLTVYATPASAVRSHALARLLLSILNNRFVTRRYANARAVQASRALAGEEDSDLLEVARDLLPSVRMHGKSDSAVFEVSVFDFLRAGGALLNADLEKGVVTLDRNGLNALLEEAISSRISDFTEAKPQRVPAVVREAAEELRKSLPPNALPSTQAAFRGSHLSLPCVQAVLRGVSEGRRYYGAMTIAVACARDGITRDAAAEIMRQFVDSNERGTNPFTLREGLAVVDWVYKHGGEIAFSCRTMREHAFDDGGRLCANCPKRAQFKESQPKRFKSSAPQALRFGRGFRR